MKPLYTVYVALSVTALIGMTLAATPKEARSGRPMRRCGTYTPTASEAQRDQFLLQKALTGKGSILPLSGEISRVGSPIIVDVYFHIITSADGKNGALTDAQIQSQIDVINAGYAGKDTLPKGITPIGPAAKTSLQFVLKGITRTANDTWFAGNDQYKMKSALRVGTAKTLNVYSNNIGAFGLLGYATFPQWYKGNPLNDGVVIAYDSLPGFPPPYGMGKTLTHESGHWAGLYHTFQNGCEKYNDFVTDTNAESGPFFGSWFPGDFPGEISDTCKGRNFPGLDPVDNYMDYTDDIGYSRFTVGQGVRMDTLCRYFRGF